jgi:hypothetical protein
MPSTQLKDAKVQEILALAEGYGKILADTAYGPEGPGLDVDFTTMETLGVAVQQSLFKGMCERLTKRQADRLPDAQPCPDCGAECVVERTEPDAPPDESPPSRPFQARGGTFELTEPQCFCRSCRRSFFPSAGGAAD